MKTSHLFAILASVITVPTMVNAASVTFDGLTSGEQLLNYYDGGFGSEGSGPGPNLGVFFSPGLVADSTAFAFGQSGLVESTDIMNLRTPFSGPFSFYFAGQGSVAFYSGPTASGSLVESDILGPTPFSPFGTNLGLVQSVAFTPGAGNSLRLDSITFGALVVPEPHEASMVALGLIALIGIFGQTQNRREKRNTR